MLSEIVLHHDLGFGRFEDRGTCMSLLRLKAPPPGMLRSASPFGPFLRKSGLSNEERQRDSEGVELEDRP